jgi:phage terminase large subunit-like protein
LGTIIELDTLIEDYNRSKKVKPDLNSFIVKNLNFYKDHYSTWIDDDDYKKCFKDFDLDSLKGCDAYMGIDLAATRDLAALVVVIEKDGILYVKAEHFLPQNDKSIVRISGLDLTD